MSLSDAAGDLASDRRANIKHKELILFLNLNLYQNVYLNLYMNSYLYLKLNLYLI